MSVKYSVIVLAASLFAWVNCASDRTCASMQSWFPGTNPLTLADNLPYKLSVTGGAYYPSSEHTGDCCKVMLMKVQFVGCIFLVQPYLQPAISKRRYSSMFFSKGNCKILSIPMQELKLTPCKLRVVYHTDITRFQTCYVFSTKSLPDT